MGVDFVLQGRLMMEGLVQKFENLTKSGSRHMAYPWTFGAKIRQFPYVHHYKTNPFVRNYILGVIVTLPISFYIFKTAHNMKKNKKHINHFDPNQIPNHELLKHH